MLFELIVVLVRSLINVLVLVLLLWLFCDLGEVVICFVLILESLLLFFVWICDIRFCFIDLYGLDWLIVFEFNWVSLMFWDLIFFNFLFDLILDIIRLRL